MSNSEGGSTQYKGIGTLAFATTEILWHWPIVIELQTRTNTCF